jgi:hypothetical protein
VGPANDQIAAYLLATYFWTQQWHAELGLGHYDENVDIEGLDRDAIDANIRYMYRAHWDFELDTRTQLIGLGSGGATWGFAVLQVHYRM